MLSKEIADTYKVETIVLVADFSKGRQIYPAIEKALAGKEIGILLNHVGALYPHPDYFTNLTEDKIWELINVNIAAANMMVYMVLPGMVERKKGAIVNVSSMSCCQPTPLLTAYSASKVNPKTEGPVSLLVALVSHLPSLMKLKSSLYLFDILPFKR